MISKQKTYNLFRKMYYSPALTIAKPYLTEENQLLQKYLKLNSVKSLICVGCGPGKYYDISKKNKLFYVGIDPIMNKYFQNCHFPYKDKISQQILINDIFENISLNKFDGEIPRPRFWIFTFNVARYIKNFWDHIKRLSLPGDIFFISVWSSSRKAKRLMDKYYRYICDSNKIMRETKEFFTKNGHYSRSQLLNIPFNTNAIIEEMEYCNVMIFKAVS